MGNHEYNINGCKAAAVIIRCWTRNQTLHMQPVGTAGGKSTPNKGGDPIHSPVSPSGTAIVRPRNVRPRNVDCRMSAAVVRPVDMRKSQRVSTGAPGCLCVCVLEATEASLVSGRLDARVFVCLRQQRHRWYLS